jgi:hypothetical protein
MTVPPNAAAKTAAVSMGTPPTAHDYAATREQAMAAFKARWLNRLAINARFLGVKRTCLFGPHTSAFDPKRTSGKLLLDYFINLREQRRWDGEAERFRRFHVDR